MLVVARNLKIRPKIIQTEWDSLEVLVLFGVIINENSMEAFESYQMTKKGHNAPIPTERWLVPFKTFEMLANEQKDIDYDDDISEDFDSKDY